MGWTTKVCGNCSRQMPVGGRCAPCRQENQNRSARERYAKDPQKKLDYDRSRKHLLPTHCARCITNTRASGTAYCAECRNEIVKKWRHENSEESNEIGHRSYENNKHKYGVLRARGKAKRRAREFAAEGSFTKEDWFSICESQGCACIDCGRNDVKLTIGHAVPLSRGGSNWPDNIIAQCGSCNSKQHNKIHWSREQIA